MALELRQLRYFVAVAEEKNFTRAAERLFMAQPPLSQQIQKLEEQLGVKLFERHTREVKLTRAGKALLSQARPILDSVERAVQYTRKAALGEVGHIGIAFVGSSIHGTLSRVLAEYRRTHPEVEIELLELTAERQYVNLKNGRLRLGFNRVLTADPQLQSVQVEAEPFLIALPSTHPLAHKADLELSDLGQDTWITIPRRYTPWLHDALVSLWHGANITPGTLEAENFHTIAGLVSSGMGVGFVVQSVASMGFPGVVFRKLQVQLPPAPLYMTFLRDDPPAQLSIFADLFERLQDRDP